MTQAFSDPSALPSSSYSVLRYEGAPPCAVRLRLRLGAPAAARLERLFQGSGGRGPEPMRPRFARHELHVAAVLAEGGYPVLAARGR